MASLRIHIGMPKTATSLIQAVLVGMRDCFAAQGAWIPATTLACHRLAVEATPAGSGLHQRPDFQHIKSAIGLDEAFKQCRPVTANAHTVILSSEYFSESDPRLLKALLESSGMSREDVTIIAVLRRQDRILVSGFNQDVKALNRTKPFAPFAAMTERHDWYARLQPWAEEFGKQAIKVQVFDRLAAEKESITCRLLDACGVRHDAKLVREREERNGKWENRSLPTELLAFKLFADRVTRPGDLDWLMDEALARGMGGLPFGLDASTVHKIIEHYRPSNRRVAAEYLGEAGDLFDSNVEEGAALPLAVSLETLCKLLAICAAELSKRRGPASVPTAEPETLMASPDSGETP